LSGKFIKVILDYLCGNLPYDGYITDCNFVDEGLKEDLIEIIINNVAEKIEGAISGGWMYLIGKGKANPVLSLTGYFVYLVVVVGQKGKNP
jgi:hypothetical protein